MATRLYVRLLHNPCTLGLLNGTSVGALTAIDKKLTAKRIIIFAVVGVGLDFVASKILSNVGEKMGQIVYKFKTQKNKPVKSNHLNTKKFKLSA